MHVSSQHKNDKQSISGFGLQLENDERDHYCALSTKFLVYWLLQLENDERDHKVGVEEEELGKTQKWLLSNSTPCVVLEQLEEGPIDDNYFFPENILSADLMDLFLLHTKPQLKERD